MLHILYSNHLWVHYPAPSSHPPHPSTPLPPPPHPPRWSIPMHRPTNVLPLIYCCLTYCSVMEAALATRCSYATLHAASIFELFHRQLWRCLPINNVRTLQHSAKCRYLYCINSLTNDFNVKVAEHQQMLEYLPPFFPTVRKHLQKVRRKDALLWGVAWTKLNSRNKMCVPWRTLLKLWR